MTSSIPITESDMRAREALSFGARTALRHGLLLAGLFVILSVLYWAAVYAIGGARGVPLDDPFIHLQYARSIWEGHPFEYNFATHPGVRSSGTSAPLWTVMLTGSYWLTNHWFPGDWLTAAYALGVLWTIPCIALTYWLVLRWTGRTAWALFAAVILMLTHPTVISAYEGMEPAAYVSAFLLGLLFYDFSRTSAPSRQTAWRLAGSAVFATGVWLRPEFLLMPALIAAERAVTLRRSGAGWVGRWLREMVLQGAVWLVCVCPYLAFNKWISGTLLPNTYTIKAVARNSTVDVEFLAGLPSAWMHKDWRAALRCVTIWQIAMAFSLVVGLFMNNTVLTLNLPKAVKQAWRGILGPAGLLAAISLIAFPMVRALVDPIGLFPFQYQRYFAQITPLMVLLGMAVLAVRGPVPRRQLVKRAILASLIGPLFWDFQAAKAVDNINDMQVHLGHWLRENTPEGSVIATNDVGAIAFYAQRRIIDTVGLTEPDLGRFYLAGGTLEEYLRRERPQYAALFPDWHAKIARRDDLFQTIYKVNLNKGGLDRNWICGGASMWVLRTCWNSDFDVKMRDEKIKAKADKAAAGQQAIRGVKGE
jgi:arabinofuranosyltransferase